jgi:DNA-binding NtrC family response regulator
MSSILKVLLVEDDPEVLLGKKQALELAGFEVEPFTDAETAATRIVPDVPAIVVCDVNLPGTDGLSLLSHARSVDNDLAVILITGHGDIAMAVNAMRQGAYDFVEKPFPPQRLIDVAARAAEKRCLVLQVRALRRQLADQQGIEFVLGLLDDSVSIRSGPAVKKVSLSEQIDRFEQVLIEDALAEHRGHAELASRGLGIPKKTLYDKIRKFGLSTDAFRSVRGGQQ